MSRVDGTDICQITKELNRTVNIPLDTMSAQTEHLRDLYLAVTGEAEIIESQEADDRSRAPIEAGQDEPGRAVSDLIRETGLDDALEGAEG